jgi:hypothetical protein
LGTGDLVNHIAPGLDVSRAFSAPAASRSRAPPGLSTQRLYTWSTSRSASPSPATYSASGPRRRAPACGGLSTPPAASPLSRDGRLPLALASGPPLHALCYGSTSLSPGRGWVVAGVVAAAGRI